jgi:hypothetical protein
VPAQVNLWGNASPAQAVTLIREEVAMKTRFKIITVFVLFVFAASCAVTRTIFVGKKDRNSFVFENFQECPGLEFRLTITQDGKAITAKGFTVAGTIRFDNVGEFDISRIIVVDLEIVGERSCTPFIAKKKYTSGPIVIESVRDNNAQPVKDRFIIDVGQFAEVK